MSSQLSYRLHGREQRPKTLRKHYRDELDTGQVKASAKEPRACSARRLVMGRSQFSARAPTASSGALRRRTVSSSHDNNVSAVRCLLVHLLMSALGRSRRSCPSTYGSFRSKQTRKIFGRSPRSVGSRSISRPSAPSTEPDRGHSRRGLSSSHWACHCVNHDDVGMRSAGR